MVAFIKGNFIIELLDYADRPPRLFMAAYPVLVKTAKMFTAYKPLKAATFKVEKDDIEQLEKLIGAVREEYAKHQET